MAEPKVYQPHKLVSCIESQLDQGFTGVLSLKAQATSGQPQKSCILILARGKILYGGTKIPTNQTLAQSLGAKINPNLINAALSMANRKLNNPNSFQELILQLIQYQVFTWQQVENTISSQVVTILETLNPYPGQIKYQLSNNFDLRYGQDGHGLDWLKIKQELHRRQQEWAVLAPKIPDIYGIPHIEPNAFKQIPDLIVKKHLQQYVNGNNTLVDIAKAMDKEPLKVAKSYAKWVDEGWIHFGNSRGKTDDAPKSLEIANSTSFSNQIKFTVSSDKLPTVLSVDDSPIVQISIKRALQNEYKVILANKATEALEILNQQPVNLLLLDLTMPDVDGLDFCKTIREMPKFRDLPIVMVTARDGLIDKMKGQIAGTNKYLTKPFEPEQLREIVSKYIKVYQT